MTIKEEFIAFYNEHLIMRGGPQGALAFLDYLETTDFFEAPASTKFHSNHEGGLAEHSLSVAKLLFKKNEEYGLGYQKEALAVCGLLHDVCKVGFYKKSDEPATEPQKKYLASLAGLHPEEYAHTTKGYASALIEWYKGEQQGEMPVWQQEYVVDDQFPLGHGEKSIFMISRYMALTDEEALAIRWHMFAFDVSIHFDYPNGFPFKKSVRESKLVTALFTADLESSNLLES